MGGVEAVAGGTVRVNPLLLPTPLMWCILFMCLWGLDMLFLHGINAAFVGPQATLCDCCPFC
jgi:hypothetical protein